MKIFEILIIFSLILLILGSALVVRKFQKKETPQKPEITVRGEEFSYQIEGSNFKQGDKVAYKSYAQDSSGNWNVTDVRYFTVE
jgi:hypothetical protein